MKTKHTKGKWRYELGSTSSRTEVNLADIFGENDEHIGQLYHGAEYDNNNQYKELEANAKLIAAAPFMLKTLIDMVEMKSTPAYIKKYAKAAIKKATP